MINEFYLKKENLGRLRGLFLQNKALPSLKLQKFLATDYFSRLQKKLAKTPFKRKNNPMAYSYSIAQRSPIDPNAKEFIGLVSSILGKKIRNIEGKWHCFGWRDYTLLNDENLEKPGVDFIFDATALWDDSGGGAVIYTDGSGSNTPMTASSNTLFIIQRNNTIQKFVKYINNKAGKNKRYLFLGRVA